MAAVAFDSLEYAHQLEAVGMPREQAEMVAKGLTTMFIHNFDALVTKDYLDTRFEESNLRVENQFIKFERKMDGRFTAIQKEMDLRFTAIQKDMDNRFAKVDKRLDKLESVMDRRFDSLELRFERIDSKFSRIYLMFGLTMATATIPILQNALG